MLDYIEYLKLPTQIAFALVGVVLVLNVVGELLEFKGKVVPEFMKLRKHFRNKKREKKETAETLKDVKKLLGEVNAHYSKDNITKRDKWMTWVNERAQVYDDSIVAINAKLSEVTEALKDNSKITEEMFIQTSRDRIIDFATKVTNDKVIVSREEFNRIFKVYDRYEKFLEERGLTNGEIDIAIHIIREAYVTFTDIMTYKEKFEQMKILYDRAKGRLDRVSQPTQEFSVDVENFIFIKEFAQWSEQLETGCLINVELDTNDIALLFLSNITINYDDRSLSMTFGNRFNKFDPKSLFDDMLGDITKSTNTLNYIKEILYPIKNGEFSAMKEALQTSRNLSMSNVLSSANEEVIIDGSGYTGRRLLDTGEYDPKQVKITGRNLVFTDDAWETCKVAIGELLLGNDNSAYGINAEAIIGDVIVGNNIRILDNNGNDLFTVVDGKIKTHIDDVVYGDSENHLQSDGSDSIIKRISSIEQTAEGINFIIEEISVDNGDGTYSPNVNQVKTSKGYTFNDQGLTIYQDGCEMKNLLNHTGMYVTRSDDEVLTANNEGVTAINLTAKQYLIVGANSRFEDYSNGTDAKRTACFYIGG